jgi:uncharacterized membrane protein YphA (DoxX/SURF4 family)
MRITGMGQSAGVDKVGAYGVRALALMLGVFFVFNGLDKLAWFADSGILAQRLDGWLQDAAPGTRWYFDTVAAPGIPVFARLVPLAELVTGAALILGFWTRLAAAMAFLMVMNFHFAEGTFYEWEFLTAGMGLPVLGGLLAVSLAGSRLPLSISRQ